MPVVTKRRLRLFYHYAVYAVGATVLLAAVTVTIVRLLLPDIGIYRGEVEAWVSRYMGYPVAMHTLDATWYGWIPHLHLTNVDLLNKAGTKAITHFESAEIRIDPVATLAKRSFIPRQLTISGFTLTVSRRSDGGFSVQGIDVGDMDTVQTGDSELADWLLRQRTIKIEKATVEWIDYMHGQEPMQLSDVALTLRKDDERLQIEGSATLPRTYGNRMDFAFDARGNVLTSNWSGELFLYASDVNPDNWYRKYRPLNMNIAGGSADISVWSTWTQAALDSLEGNLRYRDFAAQIGQSNLRVEEMAYGFSGRRTSGGGWNLDMRVNDLVTEHGLWPAANVRVRAEPVNGHGDLRYQVSFDYLKLDDLVPLVSQLDFIPAAARDKLRALGLSGEIRDGQLRFDPGAEPARQFSYEARLDGFATQLNDTHAALDNASGRVSGNLDQGSIHFAGDALEVKLPSYNLKHLQLHALHGDVRWSRGESGWSISTDRLGFATRDFDAWASGNISRATDTPSPLLDLVVEVGPGRLDAMARYIPQTEKFHLRDWLDKSVLSGNLTGASAVLHGRLSEFPFDDRSGRFQALINAENVVLDYSSLWPPIDDLGAEIEVDGRTMHAEIQGGKIFDADIVEATTGIPDLLAPEKTVNIAGRVSGTVTDLARFIEQSPLVRDPIMDRLRNALRGGDMALDLDIAVPVRSPDRQVEVSGRLQLSGSELRSHIGDYALQDIQGEVEFTRTEVHGNNISAKFNDRPVSAAVSGSKSDPDDPPSLTVSGTADEAFIVERLASSFPALAPARDAILKRMRGSADWSLSVGFLQDPANQELRERLQISSDLDGMLLDLPSPVGKAMNEAVPLTITREVGSNSASDILIRYGDILGARISMGDPAGHATGGAHLHFGNSADISRREGDVYLTGAVDALSITNWMRVFRKETDDAHAGLPDLRGLAADLRVGSFELLNHDFSDVAIVADAENDRWIARLDGPGIAGDITLVSGAGAAAQVSMQLQRLHFSASEHYPDTERLDPRKLPVLDMDVQELVYDGKELGHLTLHSTPLPEGIAIDQFAFAKPDLNISGNGNWLRGAAEDHSRFNITLHADEIDSMLQTFGYEVAAIRKGETDLSIDADWAGAPADFSLARLNGTLNMRIKKGQLLDVNPKAGRLFGLLSIQTLPRRLSLDFSDLFGKGLAFDRIEGSFDIANGNAYTNDLQLRGPSAEVIITGRTGLAAQDYDQVVTVTPQVANTIPVATALFGGPVGMGVGAVLYLAGEMFKSLHEGIDKLLRYQYTITGSWTDPVIEKFEAAEEANG